MLTRPETLEQKNGSRANTPTVPAALLSLRLSVDYPGKPSILENVSLEMQPGEVLGLVGQSGSGKSTLAMAILKLLDLRGGVCRGQLWFQGKDLMKMRERQVRMIRGRKMGLVLQSPLSSLNPALRIGTQFLEAWKAHAGGSREAITQAVLELLQRVNLPANHEFLRRYPRQLSVGQAQRVLIAQSILHRPALLIADEPTSALDSITQSEILSLFAQLNRDLEMGLLYISHDLLSVATLCHRVAILHGGELLECGTTKQVFQNPQHPYTRRLVEALPRCAL